MAVATVAGVLNVFVTSPLWTATTIITCRRADNSATDGMLGVLHRLWKTEGLAGLYRGLLPALILVSNPAIQHTVYEQLVLKIRTATGRSLSPFEIFAVGAISKLLATLITYPYQTVKARQQASRATPSGDATTSCQKRPHTSIIEIVRREGVGALYAGLSAKLLFTVLNSAFMFTFYDALIVLMRKQTL